jgi:hypothetical protein
MDIRKKLKGFANNITKAVFFLMLVIPGIMAAQPRTIVVPKIKYIALNSGNIVIKWERSTSPGILYYKIIYRRNSDPRPTWEDVRLDHPIPATDSSVSFPFSLTGEQNVESTSIAFAVEANDSSNVDNQQWDSTIFLKAAFNSCQSEVNLEWTRYDFNMWNFNHEVFYRIYISENNGPPILFTTLNNVENYSIHNLIPNKDYSIFIAAIPKNPPVGLGSDSATSITVDINTNMVVPPQYINADYATYNGSNAEVHFSIDPTGELTNFNLMRSNSPQEDSFDSITQVAPNNNQITFTDNVDYLSGPYYYRLEAINNCYLPVTTSNIASTIVLENIGEPLVPELLWNEYIEWPNSVSQYEIERKFGNSEYQLIDQTNSTRYTDNGIEPLSGSGVDASVCYRIVAGEQGNQSNTIYTSTSNEVCLELPLNIHFDFDAFIPGSSEGTNSFGPTIDFLPDEFHFEILDRSGRVVYSSVDPLDCRWTGKINQSNTLSPAGAYMYVLKYRNEGSKYHILRGGVAVVYP